MTITTNDIGVDWPLVLLAAFLTLIGYFLHFYIGREAATNSLGLVFAAIWVGRNFL